MPTNIPITWITNLKGFAILAVVLGHIDTPLTGFIFSWHIPLFLFLSGYLFKVTNHLDLIQKDFRRLILPYLFFGFLGIAVESLKRSLWPDWGFLYKYFSVSGELKALLLWMDAGAIHTYGFILWFIPALIWSKHLLIWLKRLVKNNYLLVIIGLILWFAFINTNTLWWFGLDKAFISLIWVSLGYIYRNNIDNIFRIPKIILVFVILLFCIIPTPKLNIALKTASNPAYNILYAFLFIFLLIQIFKRYNFNSLRIMGESSMLIYLIHPYSNNLSYIITVLFLHSNWIFEFITSLIMLSIFIIYGKKILYGTKYSGIVNRF